MMEERNRRLCPTVLSVVALLFAAGCQSERPEYTAKDLRKLGVHDAVGIVTKQAGGRFSLEDCGTGETHLFLTGSTTQYLPKDYRSQTGDRVRVIYALSKRRHRRKGTPAYTKKVYQLHSVTVPPENEMRMPVKGKVIRIDKGARSLQATHSLLILLEGADKTLKVYFPIGLECAAPGGEINGLVGFDVEVHLRRLPNRAWNSYSYVVERICLPGGRTITRKRIGARW